MSDNHHHGHRSNFTFDSLGMTSAPAHGIVTWRANGAYPFTLDNAAPEIDALSEGKTLTDSLTIW